MSRGPVLLAEGFPDEAPGEEEEANEEAAADNVVFRGVQLEEERLSGIQRLEGLSAPRHPEIHLVYPGQAPQEAEPVVVGDGDSESHRSRGGPKPLHL